METAYPNYQFHSPTPETQNGGPLSQLPKSAQIALIVTFVIMGALVSWLGYKYVKAFHYIDRGNQAISAGDYSRAKTELLESMRHWPMEETERKITIVIQADKQKRQAEEDKKLRNQPVNLEKVE